MRLVIGTTMLLWLLAGLADVQAAGFFDFLKKRKPGPVNTARTVSFEKDIQPLLSEYCYDCHGDGMKKGGLALDGFANRAAMLNALPTWEKVIDNVTCRLMPPANKPQPTEAQRELIAQWIESAVFKIDRNNPDPGRVTLRRLNRAEYNNTIRDLVGIDFKPATDFPADDAGYGFDNIGDVLSVSPLLLEKYLAAAEKILDKAIVNPLGSSPEALPETHRRIFTRQPMPQTKGEVARELIGNFARRAYRRPVAAAELDRLMKLFELADKNGETFETSVKIALEAVLVSPHFLFRGEVQPAPDNPRSIHPIDEYALASRLSYFLWSSMPDEELLAFAAQGRLRRNLAPQVKRMLRDPKARALVGNFAGQWLQLRNLDLVNVDRKRFPACTDELRAAMRRETELLFQSIMDEDRSLLEFLNADYTFVNGALAGHYGIPGVEGEKFAKVSLKGTPRRGVLTQASILTITSNPTRTSPVKRGLWVLENLLATPQPPPPPDVPQLAEDKKAVESASLRERLEEHRNNPMCASCHARMDPIGFGLENFNAIGAWRDQDGKFPIDAAGKLVSGESFKGPAELTAILANQKKDLFIRCLTQKMLTYALGRGLEYYDRCTVDRIIKDIEKQDCKFSSLVMGVVNSAPFQKRRGEGNRLASQN